MYLFAKNTTAILQQLRLLMVTLDIVGHEPLGAYIVPSGDQHRSLRMADCDQRRAFITGFDGGAGIAVVTQTAALLWTDARYFIQAEEQLDENWTLMREGVDPPMEEWLVQNIPETSASRHVGLDSTYYGLLEWEALRSSLNAGGLNLTEVNNTNLVDIVWESGEHTRPECPTDPVRALSLEFAGKSTREKVREIWAEMEAERANVLVVTELDEVAWLLNLRGSDLPLAPVFNAYVILNRSPKRLEMFVDPIKISEAIKSELVSQLDGEVVDTFFAYDAIFDQVRYYASNASVATEFKQRIWTSKYCNANLGSLVPAPIRILKLTPISLLKAVKNDVEADGMKRAHLRDSASIIVFLAWLQDFMASSHAHGRTISEIEAAEMLTSFKASAPNYVGRSFKTISASGPNGATVHYFPVPATDRNLSTTEMYLLDSGSHYLDGTTDITRTMHFGQPSDYERDCYTRVLKGHISIGTAVFPDKTPGSVLDPFARQYLWEVGLDYGHGTGHGIGAYLHVGEGPHSMAAKYNPDDPGLRANMFMSNEPGYYERNQFGIRLENIVRVVPSDAVAMTGAGFLQLETISFVPFARNLIKIEMLSSEEISWLNEYHEACRTRVGDYIQRQSADYGQEHASRALEWLAEATKPILP